MLEISNKSKEGLPSFRSRIGGIFKFKNKYKINPANPVTYC